jgi:hypothetical protein
MKKRSPGRPKPKQKLATSSKIPTQVRKKYTGLSARERFASGLRSGLQETGKFENRKRGSESSNGKADGTLVPYANKKDNHTHDRQCKKPLEKDLKENRRLARELAKLRCQYRAVREETRASQLKLLRVKALANKRRNKEENSGAGEELNRGSDERTQSENNGCLKQT